MAGNADGFSDLVAMLQALSANYNSSHWTAEKGPTFYWQHLLFERLYGGIADQADSLAEKLVALFGARVVAADVLAPCSRWISAEQMSVLA